MKICLLDIASQELNDMIFDELMAYVSRTHGNKEVSSVEIESETLVFNFELYEDKDLEEKQIDTRHGTLYLVKGCKLGTYRLLDSDHRILFHDNNKEWLEQQIELMNKAEHLSEYLEMNFDEVCWGSKQDCLNFAVDNIKSNLGWTIDQQECDYQVEACKRSFDSAYNRVGDLYILFEYASFY